MSRIMSVARFRIHPGRTEEFNVLAAECVRLVRQNDPATTLYEWFINDAQTECVAIDSYASSDAVLAHIRNVGPTMRKLRQLADVSVDLLGSPSAELLEALQFRSDGIYRLLDGLG
jgi:quinol monooxygenase YgiN